MDTKKFRTKLDWWLWKTRITQAEMADAMGYSRQRFNDWVSGRLRPGRKNAARIAAWTNGQVNEIDLLYPERCQERFRSYVPNKNVENSFA